MHTDLVKISLEEVRIGLASNVDRKDREGSIKLTTLDDKGAPLAEIFSPLDLLSRRHELARSIDTILEGSNESLNIILRIMRFLYAIGLQ